MKMTSKDANKLLQQLSKELEMEKLKETHSSTFVAATIENKENVRPKYSYEETALKIQELYEKIVRLKHCINTFNTNTKIPEFDLTIDEMLIYIPQLTERKATLYRMITTPEFERVPFSGRSNIIDYTYINYDLNKVKEDYDRVDETLSKAQIALDKVNISVEFEVNI